MDNDEHARIMVERLNEEMESIAPRTIEINLSDADCERLRNKAAIAGTSVYQLLADFIGDLVCGTYSHGSDERMYANEWFDRCGYHMFIENKFLAYLAEINCIGDAAFYYNDYVEAENEGDEDSAADSMDYLLETYGDFKRGDEFSKEEMLKAFKSVAEWHENNKL